MAQGHIYRRALQGGRPSKWFAVIDVPSPGGRKQLTKSFVTKREAQRWLADLTVTRTEPEGTSLSEYLPRWLSGKAGLRLSSRASYRMHVERYLIPMLGHLEVQRLTPHQHPGLASRPAEGRDRSGDHRQSPRDPVLGAGHGEAAGPAATQPAGGCRTAPQKAVQALCVDVSQASAVLSGVRGDAWEGLWWLALLSGLRRGELLGLWWRDLDLRKGTLLVDGARLRLGGDIIEDGPKTAASHRIVHLDQATVRLLRRAQSLTTGVSERYVFTDTEGRPLDPAAVSRRFHEVRQRFGLPRIRMHDLRHTSATLGLAWGESLKEVSARLGHAGISVTADLYTEVTPALARASALRLAASLDRPGLSCWPDVDSAVVRFGHGTLDARPS